MKDIIILTAHVHNHPRHTHTQPGHARALHLAQAKGTHARKPEAHTNAHMRTAQATTPNSQPSRAGQLPSHPPGGGKGDRPSLVLPSPAAAAQSSNSMRTGDQRETTLSWLRACDAAAAVLAAATSGAMPAADAHSSNIMWLGDHLRPCR